MTKCKHFFLNKLKLSNISATSCVWHCWISAGAEPQEKEKEEEISKLRNRELIFN